MATNSAIASALRGARTEARMTQGEAAKRLGRSHVTLSKYETGQSMIPFDLAVAAADLYGVSLERLAGRAR